jgi:hypothetical protein
MCNYKDYHIRNYQQEFTKIMTSMSQWTNQDIVTALLESAGVKKNIMPHGSILPINYDLTFKYLTRTPEECSEIQEAYNLEYASCIGSLIYMSYTKPDISFAVNKLKKYSKQPAEKHTTALIHLICYIT